MPSMQAWLFTSAYISAAALAGRSGYFSSPPHHPGTLARASITFAIATP
jgi:hypothetical protein